METNRRGIALPIVLGLVLCLGIWIGSLSYTMTQSRNRFQQVIKIQRSYFMARSALQHFFLKVKVMQRQCPNAMQALYNADREQWGLLSKSFTEDIVIPTEITAGFSGKYRIASFSIDSMDNDIGQFALRITAVGNADGYGQSISRVYKVSK
jgi:type II secretory pathway component PulK